MSATKYMVTMQFIGVLRVLMVVRFFWLVAWFACDRFCAILPSQFRQQTLRNTGLYIYIYVYITKTQIFNIHMGFWFGIAYNSLELLFWFEIICIKFLSYCYLLLFSLILKEWKKRLECFKCKLKTTFGNIVLANDSIEKV